MIRLKTACAGAFALLATACQTAPYSPAGYSAEPVYDWRVDRAGDLVVRVASNGCTTRDSFRRRCVRRRRAGLEFRRHADAHPCR